MRIKPPIWAEALLRVPRAGKTSPMQRGERRPFLSHVCFGLRDLHRRLAFRGRGAPPRLDKEQALEASCTGA